MINNVLTHWLFPTTRLILSFSLVVGAASCTDDIRQISQKRFMDMVKEREVKQVTIVDDQTVEVRLTPEALAGKYVGLLDNKDPLQKNNPSFQLTIVSEQAFRDELVKMNPGFPIVVEKRSLFDFPSK